MYQTSYLVTYTSILNTKVDTFDLIRLQHAGDARTPSNAFLPSF